MQLLPLGSLLLIFQNGFQAKSWKRGGFTRPLKALILKKSKSPQSSCRLGSSQQGQKDYVVSSEGGNWENSKQTRTHFLVETSVRFLITLPQLGVTWPDSGPCGLAFVVKLYTIRRNPSLKQDTFFLTACGRVRLCIYKEPKVTHRGETCPAEPPNSLLLLHLEGWIHHLGRVRSWTGGTDEPRNIGLWWIQHQVTK